MPRTGSGIRSIFLSLFAALSCSAQQNDLTGLVSSGIVNVDGRQAAYRIRHLPVSSFPDLPPTVSDQLVRRGCLIPQTYEARQPENVVHGSFEHAGSSDWAALCSSQETVSLIVFFGDAPETPSVLRTAPETERLQQHLDSAVLGFNWGIDPASPAKVHQAQIGLVPPPARLDHDALADSVVDRSTVYHYYSRKSWRVLELPDE